MHGGESRRDDGRSVQSRRKGGFCHYQPRECPLIREGEARPIVKSGAALLGPHESVELLRAGGFGYVCLANNHLGDYGAAGIRSTLRVLDESGIGYFGGGEDIGRAYRPLRPEKNGVRVSVVAACDNEFGVAGPIRRVRRAITEERERSDFAVVYYHGGTGDYPFPAPNAAERYRLFIDLGADAVIGNHPHCMQVTECYDGKPVIYSLGNLFFPPEEPVGEQAPWSFGCPAELTLEKGAPPSFIQAARRQPHAAFEPRGGAGAQLSRRAVRADSGRTGA